MWSQAAPDHRSPWRVHRQEHDAAEAVPVPGTGTTGQTRGLTANSNSQCQVTLAATHVSVKSVVTGTTVRKQAVHPIIIASWTSDREASSLQTHLKVNTALVRYFHQEDMSTGKHRL
jgi:hypothetical protein